MTFKPTTYLVSFSLFVILFMGLGGYVSYHKISDHLMAQAFLAATSLEVHVQTDRQGPELRWEEGVPLQAGVAARIAASNRAQAISIHYSDEPGPRLRGMALAANERIEDLRRDKASRYLYVRVLAGSNLKSKETTWLYRYDLQSRSLGRRITVNPIMLPAPFKP